MAFRKEATGVPRRVFESIMAITLKEPERKVAYKPSNKKASEQGVTDSSAPRKKNSVRYTPEKICEAVQSDDYKGQL